MKEVILKTKFMANFLPLWLVLFGTDFMEVIIFHSFYGSVKFMFHNWYLSKAKNRNHHTQKFINL